MRERGNSKKRKLPWEGLRWHGANESRVLIKANVATAQRMRRQWERGKVGWARPCGVL